MRLLPLALLLLGSCVDGPVDRSQKAEGSAAFPHSAGASNGDMAAGLTLENLPKDVPLLAPVEMVNGVPVNAPPGSPVAAIAPAGPAAPLSPAVPSGSTDSLAPTTQAPTSDVASPGPAIPLPSAEALKLPGDIPEGVPVLAPVEMVNGVPVNKPPASGAPADAAKTPVVPATPPQAQPAEPAAAVPAPAPAAPPVSGSDPDAAAATPTPPVASKYDLKLPDGRLLHLDGIEVTIAGPDRVFKPAEDATYITTDGKVIKTDDGKIEGLR